MIVSPSQRILAAAIALDTPRAPGGGTRGAGA